MDISLFLSILNVLRSLITLLLFFLSLWIVIPAPNLTLIVLSVGVPEISAWLVIIQILCFGITVFNFESNWQNILLIFVNIASLAIFISPLLQFPQVNAQFQQQIETNLGTLTPPKSQTISLKEIEDLSTKVINKKRSQPLIIKELFTGISIPEVRIQRNTTIAEIDNQKLTMNVYQPLAKGEKRPTLIAIYGGAWRAGTPDNDEQFSRYIASKGYTVITIDYRHAPKYQFPIQLEDVNLACQYIYDRAEELEVDLDSVAIMGRSAGSQLAMLAGYDDRIINFKGVIGYYGPIDLAHAYKYLPNPDPIDTRKVLIDYLGDSPDNLLPTYKQASPIYAVKGDLPPSLLIYAGKDHIVQPNAGRRMSQKLRDHYNTVVYLEIPWADHSFDSVFNGLSNQISLYYTEIFLAHILKTQG